jgi:hypothetical protein
MANTAWILAFARMTNEDTWSVRALHVVILDSRKAM